MEIMANLIRGHDQFRGISTNINKFNILSLLNSFGHEFLDVVKTRFIP
jgi:hypothetical protein